MLKSRVSRKPDFNRVAKAVSQPGIDPRVWHCVGYVEAFGIDEEGAFVDVTLMPSEEEVSARVASIYAGPGFGFFFPLEKDDEVIVFAPNGDPAEGLIAFGRQWSKSDPPPQGALDDEGTSILLHAKTDTNLKLKVVGDATITLEGPSVLIQDENGNPQELAFKSDVQAVVDNYNGHIHQGADTAPTSGPMGAGTILPNPGAPPPTHLPGVPTGAPNPVGTTILKSE